MCIVNFTFLKFNTEEDQNLTHWRTHILPEKSTAKPHQLTPLTCAALHPQISSLINCNSVAGHKVRENIPCVLQALLEP